MIINNRVKDSYKLLAEEVDENSLVLDLGCGFGEGVRFFTQRGIMTIGIDISLTSINECKRNDGKDYIVASTFDMPFNPNIFDAVLFLDVIEHLPPGTEEQALREIGRVMKKDGTLIISTPNRGIFSFLDQQNLCRNLSKLAPKKILFKFYDTEKIENSWANQHRHYSREDLKKILNKEGFRIINHRYRKTGLSNIFTFLLTGKMFRKMRHVIHAFDYIFSLGRFSFQIILMVKKMEGEK